MVLVVAVSLSSYDGICMGANLLCCYASSYIGWGNISEPPSISAAPLSLFPPSNVELGFLLFFGMIILYEFLHCTDPGDSCCLFYLLLLKLELMWKEYICTVYYISCDCYVLCEA